MLDIIVTYIVLHNLCIVNNERIEEEWIVGAKKQKGKRITEHELQENSELWGEKTKIVEVKR